MLLQRFGNICYNVIYYNKKRSIMEENNTNTNLKECLNYLYTQIGKYSKSKKGYQDKLYEKGFSPSVIAEAISIAEQKRFINDDNFAENYVRSNMNKKGILKMKNELLFKGVPAHIIDKYLNINQNEAALNLARKYMQNKDIDYNTIGKLYRHMLSKGFGYDTASNVIDIIKSEREI